MVCLTAPSGTLDLLDSVELSRYILFDRTTTVKKEIDNQPDYSKITDN